jgi:sugar/nucleoside kinase (ribokinase family)
LQIKGRIFCLGHISVDIIVHRTVLDDLKVGGCISSQDIGIYCGGDTANVSYWLGKLKIPTSMIGVIGDDPSGSLLKTDLEKVNVECRLKYSQKYPSSSILIIVEPDGERSHIINGESQNDLQFENIPLTDIKTGRLFYTSAYTIENEPIRSAIQKLFFQIKNSNRSSTKTMFNLAAYTTVESHRDFILSNIVPYTDVLVGNQEEFNALTQNMIDCTQNEIDTLGKLLHDKFSNLEVILITNGNKGCSFTTNDQKGHILAPKIQVLDTTGAGDGFCAGFISGYVTGRTISDSVLKGVKLGSQICKGYGARYSEPRDDEMI